MKKVFLAIVLLFFSDNAWANDEHLVKDSDYRMFTEHLDTSLENYDKEFSIETGAAYSYWLPQDIGNAEVKTSGIDLFWIEFKTRTFQDLNKLIRVPKLRYETSLTGGDFSYQDEEVIRVSDDEESYIHFLGMLQIATPITFRYETESYTTELSPKTDINYIPYSGQDVQSIRKGSRLYYETTFHDYAFEYEFKENSFAGLFYGEYQKPYTATISGIEITPESIFYSKITSYGFIFENISTPLERMGGLSMNISFKVGLGDIDLADNYKISHLLKTDKGVAFLNPKLALEYKREIYDKIEFHVFSSVDYRYFYQYDKDSGDTNAVIGVDDINSDLLLKCFVSVAYLF